jgi:hypothetical protein
VFWGEIAPVEHSVQIYSDDVLFMDSLEGFASGGLRSGDGVIIIATAAHRSALERRLRARGFDVDQAAREQRYISIDAQATLERFMVNGWPDDDRFQAVAADLITRARGQGRRVRAFGEMVALLWSQGQNVATVHLEHLWNRVRNEELFCLFCAYPRGGFTHNAHESINEICSHHSREIPE